MKKRSLQAGAIIIAALLTLTACQSGKLTEMTTSASNTNSYSNDSSLYSLGDIGEATADIAYENYDQAAWDDYDSGDTVSGAGISQTDRKLIKRAYFQVETLEYDQLVPYLENLVNDLGGYIESAYTRGTSYNSSYKEYRYTDLTVRVPADKLELFTDTVKEAGNVTSHSTETEDVTLSYTDVESRKKMLEVEQSRLMELLEKAETIEDIITIESRLTDIRYQLEYQEQQLRYYDNHIDYCMISLAIYEVEKETPVEEQTTWQKITTGFTNSISGVMNGISSLLIGIIINLPYLIVIAVIASIIFIIIHRHKKKQIKKEDKL